MFPLYDRLLFSAKPPQCTELPASLTTFLPTPQKTCLQEGMEKGIELSNLSAIRHLMTNLDMTAEQAMETLEIPNTDRQKYAQQI